MTAVVSVSYSVTGRLHTGWRRIAVLLARHHAIRAGELRRALQRVAVVAHRRAGLTRRQGTAAAAAAQHAVAHRNRTWTRRARLCCERPVGAEGAIADDRVSCVTRDGTRRDGVELRGARTVVTVGRTRQSAHRRIDDENAHCTTVHAHADTHTHEHSTPDGNRTTTISHHHCAPPPCLLQRPAHCHAHTHPRRILNWE